MRTRRIFAAAAGSLMLLVGMAGPASAQANNEHVRLVLGDNTPADGKIIASGPISGTGTLHHLTRDTDLVKIPGQGTFVLAHHFTSHNPPQQTGPCTFTFSDTGTFRISQGTGHFAGLVGHGTFKDQGTFESAQLPGGGCSQQGRTFRVVVTGAGYVHPAS